MPGSGRVQDSARPGWWATDCFLPGETIILVIKDAARLPGWRKIELYRASTLLDSLTPGHPLQFAVTASDTPSIQAYNLLAYDNTARVYPSILYSVIVSPWTNTYDPPTAVLRPLRDEATARALTPLRALAPGWFDLAARAVPPVGAHRSAPVSVVVRQGNGRLSVLP